MTSGFTDAADIERGFQQLIQSQDWRRLAKMPGVADAFNVFQVLDDAVCENSWSRILAVLFSSSGGHDLGMRPLRQWLSEVGDSRFNALAKRAASSSTLCEWGTMERRRLDILIKLLNGRGHLIGIIGVENKVWSGEQHDQLKDYQSALCDAFSAVPKMLLFLTPDEREPLTGVVSGLCPCHRCSCKTLVSMCDKLHSSANGGMRLLLSSLHDFIDQNILTASIMKTRIEQVARRLYLNRNHRMVLETIFEHRPTLEGLRSHIDKAAGDYFAREKPRINCEFGQWPERAANPPEIKIYPEPLAKPGFGISYMLRSKARRPFIGDSFTILIAAWCSSGAARTRVQNLNARLPKRLTHNFRNWSDWEVIWEGDTYELQDLNGRDARNLSRLLVKTISQTYRPLKSAVSKL